MIPIESVVCNDPDHCGHVKQIQTYYNTGECYASIGQNIPTGKGKRCKKSGWDGDLKEVNKNAKQEC